MEAFVLESFVESIEPFDSRLDVWVIILIVFIFVVVTIFVGRQARVIIFVLNRFRFSLQAFFVLKYEMKMENLYLKIGGRNRWLMFTAERVRS